MCIFSLCTHNYAETGWAMLLAFFSFRQPPSVCLFHPLFPPSLILAPSLSQLHWATSAACEYHPSPPSQPPEAIANPASNCQLTKLFSQQERGRQGGREQATGWREQRETRQKKSRTSLVPHFSTHVISENLVKMIRELTTRGKVQNVKNSLGRCGGLSFKGRQPNG